MISDEAVEAARRELAKGSYQMRPDELPYADAARRALEAAAPFITVKLAAEVEYQKARAAYFKYFPEIDYDPEGVQELLEVMRRARAKFIDAGGKP